MCARKQQLLLYTIGSEREKEKWHPALLHPPGRREQIPSIFFFFSFLIEYIVVSFRRFFVCGAAVHKNETDGENQQRRRIIYDAANTKQEKKLRLFEIINKTDRFRFIYGILHRWVCHLDSKSAWHTIKIKRGKTRRRHFPTPSTTADPMDDVTTTVMCNQPVPLSRTLCSRFLSPYHHHHTHSSMLHNTHPYLPATSHKVTR